MSALAFRNVDVSPDQPVSEWPLEAVQTALERGGLSSWRRLADEIRAQPWGPVARRVEEVLRYSRPYGISEAMERLLDKSREATEAAERKAVAAEIDRLVRDSGLSRAEFASRIGTSASRLSTYATGRVTPSAGMLVRMRHVHDLSRPRVSVQVEPDPHDVELADRLLDLPPEERLRSLGRYAQLHGSAQREERR